MHLLSHSDPVQPLSALVEGDRGIVHHVVATRRGDRLDQLLALGVTPGAAIVVLQTMPGIIVWCDQTELAIERAVAEAILVALAEECP